MNNTFSRFRELGKLFCKHGGLVTIGSLLVIFGPVFLKAHLSSINSNLALDDARPQIPPFFRFAEESPSLTDDYIAQYYLDAYPLGYKLLYASWARFGGDPRHLGKLLHPLLQLVVATALGFAAFRIGRWPAVFLVCALVMSGSAFMTMINGGLSRAFGFPVIAICLAGLLHGSRGWMFAAVVLGALFYPVSGLLSGLVLALYLLTLEPGFFQAQRTEKLKRAGLGIAAAITGFILLLPPLLLSAQYGPGLDWGDAQAFPEIGPFGTARGITNTYVPMTVIQGLALNSLIGHGTPINPWYIVFMRTHVWGTDFPIAGLILLALTFLAGAGCFWRLLVRDTIGSRLFLFFTAVIIGFLLSGASLPYFYLPNRYILLGIPPFTLLALAAGLQAYRSFAETRTARSRPEKMAQFLGRHTTLLGSGFLLFTMGSFGQGLTHFNLESPKHYPGLYKFLASQPPNNRVAGWPTLWGDVQSPIESVAYFSRQPILLSYETHVVFQKGFIQEFRNRFQTLAEAFLSPSDKGLRSLVEEYQVRFLLVEPAELEDPHIADFTYVEPMQSSVNALLRDLRQNNRQPALKRLLEAHPEAVVFEENGWAVVDLPLLLKLTERPKALATDP